MQAGAALLLLKKPFPLLDSLSVKTRDQRQMLRFRAATCRSVDALIAITSASLLRPGPPSRFNETVQHEISVASHGQSVQEQCDSTASCTIVAGEA
jgi:hypothetical protein